jgi:hypothetical protein
MIFIKYSKIEKKWLYENNWYYCRI